MAKKKDLRTKEERATARKGFAIAMRQTAMEYEESSSVNGGELSFKEFSSMMREREVGIHSEVALQQRFNELDKDHSETIDSSEFIRWALRDAMLRSAANLDDIFRDWDEDGNGHIDRDEFRTALRSYGFLADDSLITGLFDDLAKGMVDPEVLVLEPLTNRFLREIEQRKRPLQGLRNLKERGVVPPPAAAEPASIVVDPRRPLAAQVLEVLRKQSARVLDLFRSWDEDNDGLISKKEFRQCLAVIGFDVLKADADSVFGALDADGSGALEYHELARLISPQLPISVAPPEIVHLRNTDKATLKQGSAEATRSGALDATAMDAAAEGIRLPPIESARRSRSPARRYPKQRIICRPPPIDLFNTRRTTFSPSHLSTSPSDHSTSPSSSDPTQQESLTRNEAHAPRAGEATSVEKRRPSMPMYAKPQTVSRPTLRLQQRTASD